MRRSPGVVHEHRDEGKPKLERRCEEPCEREDVQEAGMLVSALGTALASCQLSWPALVPFDEGTPSAYWGVAWVGTATVHFRTGSLHSRRTPLCLTKASLLGPACPTVPGCPLHDIYQTHGASLSPFLHVHLLVHQAREFVEVCLGEAFQKRLRDATVQMWGPCSCLAAVGVPASHPLCLPASLSPFPLPAP